MNSKFSPVFKKLKAMGVPVYEHPEDDGGFSIDAEADGAERWADYYGNPYREELVFGVHLDVERVLEKAGLFSEWVNPGRVAVYEA